MKILIIRAGALGDTLMLMPLVNALKRGHEIIIMGRRPGIDYLEPYVDKCIDMERGGWYRLFAGDMDSDIPVPHADHVIAFVTDPEKIMSENLRQLLPGSIINVFPPFPDPGTKTHVALYMACLLESSGLPVDCKSAFDMAKRKPAMPFHRITGNTILLHPGSGSKKKNYSPGFWFDLFHSIMKVRSFGLMNIRILLGPAEEYLKDIFEKMAEENNIKTIFCDDRERLLSLLNNTGLYIGHDSGVTHLSAMLGVNTVAVYKISSIHQWHPVGPSVRIIGPERDTDRILKKIMKEAVMLLSDTGDVSGK